jgi:sulfatase maturation enzyme AslB (radical SAM superfamily)
MNAPLKLTPELLKARLGDRTIYVFSVNLDGSGYIKLFTRHGFRVGGFIDSRQMSKAASRGHQVFHPDKFFAEQKAEDVAVVITTQHRPTRRWAIGLCEQLGLVRGETFFIATDLCDYMPTIEVAGLCNLRCISCNMGVPGANINGGFMSADNYRKVLEKMSQEIPFLNSVYLYQWGEPLINPQIDEIIRITAEFGIACEISTNLMNIKNLEKAVAAQPEFFVVPCSGTGKNFERMRTGGKWEQFRSNLFELRRLLDKYDANTVVRMHYHMYNNNLDDDYDAIQALAGELGFQFKPVMAQIFPEYVLRNVIYNEPIPKEMQEASTHLVFPIEEQLAHAQANKDRNCFMIKVFPVVRWDLSVVQCSNLTFPTVSKSYLDMSLDELLRERIDNKFCDSCMDHGMHRYFDVASEIKTVDGKRVVTRI